MYVGLAELIFYAAIYLTMAVLNQKALATLATAHTNFISLRLYVSKLFFYHFHYFTYKMYLKALYGVNKELN